MNGDEFKLVHDRLLANDEEAWSDIKSHMGIMISSLARKEKIELAWIASDNRVLEGRNVQFEVCSRFRAELISGRIAVDCFADYKEVVGTYSREVLAEWFANFYQDLKNNNGLAWKKVNERLHIYAAKWLSERSVNSGFAKDIFQESVITLCEKVLGNNLKFETSRELKSYYFRILELKVMEYYRKVQGHRQKYSDSDLDHLDMPFLEEGFELDDKYFYIEKIMINTISKEEYHILKRYYFHGDKLKSIARSLKISDLNCRQKKHQALRKIASVYEKIEAQKKDSRRIYVL
ncbi:MAG: sigma-70 family RNA polymerase sigma factor [Bacteroidetes bacterium]|nr:sigma-70 family RNA polymerase sigma factor [Bacteroidota bacterium]